MARKFPISHVAMALALAVGLGGLAPQAALAKDAAPKVSFSPGFSKGAADLDKALTEAQKNPAVTAASAKAQAADGAARTAAAAEVDAAMGGFKAKLDALEPSVSTGGDKLKYGDMVRIYGGLVADPAIQHKGSVLMLQSGALSPANTAQLNWIAGVTAYQTADYQGAIPYLKAAVDAGFHDSGNMIGAVLADSYKRTNNTGAALQLAQQEIAAAKAAGTKPSETSLRTQLQAAYDAKQADASADAAAQLVAAYPNPQTWNVAISVVRQLLHLPTQDNLDLMRLMLRTGSMNDKRDYLEYLEDLDARRNPGETLKVVDAGIGSGKLTAAEAADSKRIASARLAADQASLPGLEKDARGGNGATAMAAGDAFLNYGQSAKAEEMYKLAAGRAGVDKGLAMLRAGIAQIDQGKVADAQASFGQVTGQRAAIGKLWAAYAATKGTPAQ